jgi:hypothetical protein
MRAWFVSRDVTKGMFDAPVVTSVLVGGDARSTTGEPGTFPSIRVPSDTSARDRRRGSP